jgi:hypothetical protein
LEIFYTKWRISNLLQKFQDLCNKANENKPMTYIDSTHKKKNYKNYHNTREKETKLNESIILNEIPLKSSNDLTNPLTSSLDQSTMINNSLTSSMTKSFNFSEITVFSPVSIALNGSLKNNLKEIFSKQDKQSRSTNDSINQITKSTRHMRHISEKPSIMRTDLISILVKENYKAKLSNFRRAVKLWKINAEKSRNQKFGFLLNSLQSRKARYGLNNLRDYSKALKDKKITHFLYKLVENCHNLSYFANIQCGLELWKTNHEIKVI